MITLTNNQPDVTDTQTEQARITSVRFADTRLYVVLNDGREVSLPIDRIPWLRWLAQATPEQRECWSLEPGGFAVNCATC